jgi:endonuclease-3
MPPRKARTWQAHEIVEILDAFYGRAPHRPSGAPMSELVLTLLSQHTSDHNSGRAFHRLLERFPDWDSVIAAPTSEVEDAIRPGGLAPTKAPRLQVLVNAVRERYPDFDLHELATLPLEDARAWLRSIPGVGPKTAACVLLFALGRPALPVDTHVDRVSRRLGLVAPKASVDQAHVILEGMVPDEDMYAFHIDLIQHGRRTCHARGPVCEACPLLEHCPRIGVAPPKTEATKAAAKPATKSVAKPAAKATKKAATASRSGRASART